MEIIYVSDILTFMVEGMGILTFTLFAVISGIVLGILLIGGVWYFFRYRKRKRKAKDPQHSSWDEAVLGGGKE